MTTNQEAIRRLFKVAVDNTGNLPPLPGIYPDYSAPIVRNSAAGCELAMARWGMPTPPKVLVGKKSDPGVTNVRNATSSHWRGWLGVECRCLVPFNNFAEPDNGTFGGRAPVWFAFDESRPLACFAGI
jgi:putative SOS response-associated peptidase YedK